MGVPLQEIGDVAAERLKTGVGLSGPHGGYFADEHRVEDFLELTGHYDKTLNGLLQVDKCRAYFACKSVVANQLLSQHGVHRLVVHNWIALDYL